MTNPEINNPDYQAGYADGQADAQTLLLPSNTGAHTQAEHDRIHEKCARCLMPADAYEAGYGAGLDDAVRARYLDLMSEAGRAPREYSGPAVEVQQSFI